MNVRWAFVRTAVAIVTALGSLSAQHSYTRSEIENGAHLYLAAAPRATAPEATWSVVWP